MPNSPVIPETIVVHLGSPDSNAQNVTVAFPDYIKNVASSEIYPTWPEAALRANILAQISVALNRVYTEYYRSQGKDFDITSSTANDQSFVYQRNVYDSVSRIVDEIFNSYIRKTNSIEPLFATFCDGIEVSCNGLSQWGSVELANQGKSYLEILRNYYGDVEVVENVSVKSAPRSAPSVPLKRGDTGRDVEYIQLRLNRISTNYPAIPKIYPIDGFFSESTEAAVKEFQRVFNLTDDGVVGSATWYKIQFVYNAVKNLFAVNSEGLKYGDLPQNYPADLRLGSASDGVLVLQYYLEYISTFVPTVMTVIPDGVFGPQTEASVISFQQTYGLPITGIVDRGVWNAIQSTYYNTLGSVNFRFFEGSTLPYPGRVLTLGSRGEDVRALQEYLNYIGRTFTEIPPVTVDGDFGTRTEAAVVAFNRIFDISTDEKRVTALTWNAITDTYEDLYFGSLVSPGQYPGYVIE